MNFTFVASNFVTHMGHQLIFYPMEKSLKYMSALRFVFNGSRDLLLVGHVDRKNSQNEEHFKSSRTEKIGRVISFLEIW